MDSNSKSDILNVPSDRDDQLRTNSANGSDHPLHIEVFEDETSLFQLREEWDRLSEQSGSSVYQSHEWINNWWKHFGKNRQRSLFLITIWDDQSLIALAPFFSGYSTFGTTVVDRRLQLIGSGGSPNEQTGFLDDYGISDFLDFIVDKNYEDRAARIFAEYLADAEVHHILFHQAGDHSFIIRKLCPALKYTGVEISKECTDTCPYIDLSGQKTLPEYIKQTKSNARRRFRQTLRAMGPDKEYVIEDVNSTEEIEKATEALIELHQDRWNELGFPGVFHDKRFKAFFKDLIQGAHENGSLWFRQAIDSSGEVCASRMILFYNGRYYDYISGFNANHSSSKYRPGIGLLLKLVETALDNGVDRIELLRGEETYKYDFTDRSFRNWKLVVKTARKKSRAAEAGSYYIRLKATLFKYGSRERRLLQVQRNKSGIAGMIPGYLKFRWQSVKLKLKGD